MARIAVNTYMVRYPLGGNLSWALQWIVGLQRLGHDVYVVEKSGYRDACFDLGRNIMTDDCRYGVSIVIPIAAAPTSTPGALHRSASKALMLDSSAN